MKRAGFFIIIVGLLLLIFTALTYFSKDKEMVNGTAKVNMSKSHRSSWTPLAGVALFGAGGAVLLMAHERPRRKRRFSKTKDV
jgi:hypothetical protein